MTSNVDDSGTSRRVPDIGEEVTVETADGHRFLGRVLQIRFDDRRGQLLVLLLDTGWQVTYPVSMIRSVRSPHDISAPLRLS